MVHLPVSVAGTCFLCQVLSPHLPLNASFQKHGHTESYRVIPNKLVKHILSISSAWTTVTTSILRPTNYLDRDSLGALAAGAMARWPNGPMAHSLGPSRAHAGPMGMTPNSSNLVYDILVTCAGSTIPTILDEGRHFWMPPLVSVFQR